MERIATVIGDLGDMALETQKPAPPLRQDGEMVSVPRELLLQVLRNAASDNYALELELSHDVKQQVACSIDRKRLYKLIGYLVDRT